MHKFQTYSFPLKLKMLRLETGKSQEEFSSALGISRSCLANYEAGKRYPGQDMLSKIAELCNVMPTFLIDEPQFHEVTLNEAEIDKTQKLKKLIQDRGNVLDISHLSTEHKLSLVNFYEYVLSSHRQKSENAPNEPQV